MTLDGQPLSSVFGLQPPKLKLSKHVQVSDKFRARYDAWLIKRFGRQEGLLRMGEVYVHPETSALVRREKVTS